MYRYSAHNSMYFYIVYAISSCSSYTSKLLIFIMITFSFTVNAYLDLLPVLYWFFNSISSFYILLSSSWAYSECSAFIKGYTILQSVQVWKEYEYTYIDWLIFLLSCNIFNKLYISTEQFNVILSVYKTFYYSHLLFIKKIRMHLL